MKLNSPLDSHLKTVLKIICKINFLKKKKLCFHCFCKIDMCFENHKYLKPFFKSTFRITPTRTNLSSIIFKIYLSDSLFFYCLFDYEISFCHIEKDLTYTTPLLVNLVRPLMFFLSFTIMQCLIDLM